MAYPPSVMPFMAPFEEFLRITGFDAGMPGLIRDLGRRLKEAFEVRAKLEREAVASRAVTKEDLGRSHDYSRRSENGEVVTTRNDVIRAIQSKCRRKRIPLPPEAKG